MNGRTIVQRFVGPAVDIQGLIPPSVVLTLQQLLGNQMVRFLLGLGPVDLAPRTGSTGSGAGEGDKVEFTQEMINEIVKETIAETLEAYNKIPVVVKEERPLPEAVPATGESTSTEGSPDGPAAKTSETVTKREAVRAVYYINSGSEEIKDARKAAGYWAVVRSLGDRLSVLTGKNGRLSAGKAVKYGKASPEDLGLFIDP